MRALEASYPGGAVSLDTETLSEVSSEPDQGFAECLVDCSALTFRVALGVLHNHEDAEGVAQEASCAPTGVFIACATGNASAAGSRASPGDWPLIHVWQQRNH